MKNIINIYMILNLAYKTIIIILSIVILTFLFFGNYNIVEGLTLNEEVNEFQKLINVANKENEDLKDIEGVYVDHDLKRKRQIGMEGFTAKIENDCSTNFSELGVTNNKSNRLANIQCEALKTLRGKNSQILGKNFQRDYQKYATKN